MPAEEQAGGVEFFDALAERPLVCQDDVIHSALLLKTDRSAPTYAERAAMARRLGLVEADFDRPATEAATIGEVSKVLVRVTDPAMAGEKLSQERAVSRLVTRGWLPSQAKSYQGLTGSQLVTLISTAREELATRPQNAGSVQVASDEPVARPRPEPMPVVAAAPKEPPPSSPPAPTTPAAAKKPEPTPATSAKSEPVVAPEPPPPPVVKQPEPSTPPAPPPAPASKPNIWVPGKPLKKPSGGGA